MLKEMLLGLKIVSGAAKTEFQAQRPMALTIAETVLNQVDTPSRVSALSARD
jgi:hypothetical protein